MIVKDLISKHLPPIFTIGNIIRVWIWSPFRWHIYLVVERKPVKMKPGPMKDLNDYWLSEFKKRSQ